MKGFLKTPPNYDVLLIRAVFVVIFVATAWFLRPFSGNAPLSAVIALSSSLVIIFFEFRIRRASFKALIGGTLGIILGFLCATLVGSLLSIQDGIAGQSPALKSFVTLSVVFSFGYIGLLIGATKFDFRDLISLGGVLQTGTRIQHLILDTSVIIDGRVADIAETGFLAGRLVIPQFVLRELQQVADSADSAKRNRGRRGLDILQRIQKNPNLDITITDVDFPDIREVDLKLIELAKQLDGKIVTNDFNLNKVSQLRGVPVLNINELANALRPVVLPGEIMRVFILKEGKEYNQGVAYLDDGTMVVVDNARRNIGKTIDVNVTSVLQTTAGKMIFGRFNDESSIRPEASIPPRDPREARMDRTERSERPERLNAPRPITPTPSPKA